MLNNEDYRIELGTEMDCVLGALKVYDKIIDEIISFARDEHFSRFFFRHKKYLRRERGAKQIEYCPYDIENPFEHLYSPLVKHISRIAY